MASNISSMQDIALPITSDFEMFDAMSTLHCTDLEETILFVNNLIKNMNDSNINCIPFVSFAAGSGKDHITSHLVKIIDKKVLNLLTPEGYSILVLVPAIARQKLEINKNAKIEKILIDASLDSVTIESLCKPTIFKAVECARLLIDGGVDINSLDQSNKTPLGCLIDISQDSDKDHVLPFIKLYLRRGGICNDKENSKRTANALYLKALEENKSDLDRIKLELYLNNSSSNKTSEELPSEIIEIIAHKLFLLWPY